MLPRWSLHATDGRAGGRAQTHAEALRGGGSSRCGGRQAKPRSEPTLADTGRGGLFGLSPLRQFKPAQQRRAKSPNPLQPNPLHVERKHTRPFGGGDSAAKPVVFGEQVDERREVAACEPCDGEERARHDRQLAQLRRLRPAVTDGAGRYGSAFRRKPMRVVSSYSAAKAGRKWDFERGYGGLS